MAVGFAIEVARLRDLARLSDRDIARLTGVEASTVRAWLRRTRTPSGVRAERIAELSAVVERLARVMRPDYIPVWLHKPIAALDDDQPLDVLARGEYRRLSVLIAALDSAGLAPALMPVQMFVVGRAATCAGARG